MNYVAVIGDVRRSRRAPARAELQRLLEQGLEGVNTRFAGEIAARFVVTLGDEFQVLLVGSSSLIEVIGAVDAAVGGAAVRYGVGRGQLATELKSDALRMDGPCFHAAREAVMRGKRDDRWVTVAGFGDDDDVLNGLLWLVGSVRWQWTDVQRRTVNMARSAETQKQVAAARGVSVNAVSKALKAALHEQVLAAELAASALLIRHDEPESRR